ncbi:hypothetical protein E2C01_092036 [Portunus trituberculatus]|uniref:Uncharacterized protein n=1 Tax=Portunus trituberculatus TaxID=210409 RepID=A0A5B7JJ38_PORTR|nr:hypothetical protein [Portunus trituberculatus]
MFRGPIANSHFVCHLSNSTFSPSAPPLSAPPPSPPAPIFPHPPTVTP